MFVSNEWRCDEYFPYVPPTSTNLSKNNSVPIALNPTVHLPNSEISKALEHINYGLLFLKAEDHIQAEICYSSALNLLKNKNSPHVLRVLKALRLISDKKLSRDCSDILKMKENIHDPVNEKMLFPASQSYASSSTTLAQHLLYKGVFQLEKGDLDRAKESFTQGLTIAVALENNTFLKLFKFNLLSIYFDMQSPLHEKQFNDLCETCLEQRNPRDDQLLNAFSLKKTKIFKTVSKETSLLQAGNSNFFKDFYDISKPFYSYLVENNDPLLKIKAINNLLLGSIFNKDESASIESYCNFLKKERASIPLSYERIIFDLNLYARNKDHTMVDLIQRDIETLFIQSPKEDFSKLNLLFANIKALFLIQKKKFSDAIGLFLSVKNFLCECEDKILTAIIYNNWGVAFYSLEESSEVPLEEKTGGKKFAKEAFTLAQNILEKDSLLSFHISLCEEKQEAKKTILTTHMSCVEIKDCYVFCSFLVIPKENP